MSSTTTPIAIEVGQPYPLGATVVDGGVNFALFSAHAQKVELCLFDPQCEKEIARVALPDCTNQVWHGFIPGLEAGALYGYRVYGPFEPKRGHRFNPRKLLIDPYAKQLSREFVWDNTHYAYPQGNPAQDLSLDDQDNQDFLPKSVVVGASEKPRPISKPVAWTDTVIYEAHVKGFTKLLDKVPEEERGTYLGLAHDQVIEYLQDLGVTSIELLPVHAFVSESFLVKRQLSNYWGYNTLNFFVPHQGYASSDSIAEFKEMVSRFHDAGIEVILDVVYNHTCEGNHLGPTLSFRGVDNASYYHLEKQDARFYANDTGCGNTVNVAHPRVLQMVMDSLRYWVTEMGVDGFRFDLATVLGREFGGFDRNGGFLDAVGQDPILNKVKLIAEPWDIGPGGYQLGGFPPGWSEWNDRYRDTIRRYWRGDDGLLPEFARRIHGSSDVFEHQGRKPYSTVNFVTSHDGFTLRDLVSYNQRHNYANKENNNDGHHANFSHNFGVEGDSNNENVESLRLRQQRNYLATLILSQGTPLLLAGDELGRSQQGNNNAYCQDNEINWLDWSSMKDANWRLRNFVRNTIRIRREFPLLRSPFYIHKPSDKEHSPGYNIHWLNKSGKPMTEPDWSQKGEPCVGWMLESVVNASCVHCLLTLFNPSSRREQFDLPESWHWVALLDTATDDGIPVEKYVDLEARISIEQKSMIVLYGMSNQCDIKQELPEVVSKNK